MENYVYSSDPSWYSLWNLDPLSHQILVNMLHVCLGEASRLKVLPVVPDQSITTEELFADGSSVAYAKGYGLRGLYEPTEAEIGLVSSTIRACLQLQAIPPIAIPTVTTALRALVDLLMEYTEQCAGVWYYPHEPAPHHEAPNEWVRGDITCQTYGLIAGCLECKAAVHLLETAIKQYQERVVH